MHLCIFSAKLLCGLALDKKFAEFQPQTKEKDKILERSYRFLRNLRSFLRLNKALLFCFCKLAVVKLAVEAALHKQLFVVALLNYVSVSHNEYNVSPFDG